MMKEHPDKPYELETEWIRGFATTYLPAETGFSFSSKMLKAADASIVQIRHVLRTGSVVYADKLDDPGALWVLQGEDQDGVQFELELVVVTDMQSVVLRQVTKTNLKKEKGNDAA